MPKSVHRLSFQSSLQAIPESEQVHQSHELQDFSSPNRPESTRRQSELRTKKSKRVGEGEDAHHFQPSGEVGDFDHVTLPGGRKVGFGLIRWWRANIARVLPAEADARDHFALERTFLAYIRTSNALASSSVAIFQLSRLSSPSKSSQPSPSRVLTFEKATTIIMIVSALLLTAVGCGRFLVLQKKVEHGRWRIGGGEVWSVGWGFALMEILLFVAILLN